MEKSSWNQENRFTGWTDIDLSSEGREQAQEAGRTLHEHGYEFDVAYTSVLKRAIRSLWIVLDEMDLMWIPVHNCWRLNERHYGALQGLNKSETAAAFGAGQVKLWRRSYDVRPPQITPKDERYNGRDVRYVKLRPDQLPLGESLKDTESRVWACWKRAIAPALQQHKKVLVVAHGNSLRALVKRLDDISGTDIADVEISCGIPLIYELDPDLNRVGSRYLGDTSVQPQSVAGREIRTPTVS